MLYWTWLTLSLKCRFNLDDFLGASMPRANYPLPSLWPKKLAASLLAALLLTALPGCSLVGNSSSVIPHTGPQPPHVTSSVPLQDGFQRKPIAISDIEVVWEVDSNSADYYWIQYGFHPDNIEYTVKVQPNQLTKEHDLVQGELYIFLLKDIPTSTPVYVQIASEQDGVLSPFSRVFEVPAVEQAATRY